MSDGAGLPVAGASSTAVSAHGLCDLKVLEQVYLKVVEASPDAKVVVDESGRIIVFNLQAELMFGYDRSEVLGGLIEQLVPDALRERHGGLRQGYFREPLVREMAAGRALHGRHRNGSEFAVQIKLAPLIVAGAGVHVLAVVRRAAVAAPRTE